MLKVGRGASAPPFIVMDVIAAANARQARLPAGAPKVIRMEVGQPGTGAPAGAVRAGARARGAGLPAGARRVIRMGVGHPGPGAPAGAVAAAAAALRSGDP